VHLVRAVAIGGLVVAALGIAGTASAHATLLLTDPADGSRVAKLPGTVTLTFNQPVLAIGTVIQVVGPAGDVAQGKPVLVDREVHQAVRPGAPNGGYRVMWRVTSADGHPISGQFAFAAGKGASVPAAGASVGPLSGSSGTSGSSGGSNSSLIWVLITGGVSVLVAAVLFATRRPGPTLAADEVRAKVPGGGLD
jgi:methionine-rich copper-binding protein CopC